ncbi:MAG TPA: hypothetical protein VIN75_18790 [Burkholderiaceae bacterium]
MDQREFEAVVDEFGADVQDLVELVETARYEQATAVEISRLLDAREDLLVLVNKLPALRAAEPPPAMNVPLASLRARIAHAREALKSSHDSREILQMVAETGETFAGIVAPLQAAGRWPKGRSR